MKESKSKLKNLVEKANGMLPFSVYEEIYNQALKLEGKNIIEVGTAHGAASIALALGGSARNPEIKIWTIDKLGGKYSSRSKFGSIEFNKNIVHENFKFAGVDHLIELFVGSSDEFISSNLCPEQIDMLMLDADGKIDRDLMHFYPRMVPGSPIIIDDVDPNIFFNTNHEGILFIDLKHRITSLLLNAYEKAGFIENINRINNTAFCKRGEREFDKNVFTDIAIDCYRELVCSDFSGNLFQNLALYNDNPSLIRNAFRLQKDTPRPIIKIAEGNVIMIDYEPESEQVSLTLKVPTDKINCNFEIVDSSGNYITISGWGVLTGLNSDAMKSYILLKKNETVVVFTTIIRTRPDVTTYFKDSGLNLDSSGFSATIPTENLKKGHYQVGLFIVKENKTGMTYTDKYIDISK